MGKAYSYFMNTNSRLPPLNVSVMELPENSFTSLCRVIQAVTETAALSLVTYLLPGTAANE